MSKVSWGPILVKIAKVELNLPLQNEQVSIAITDSTCDKVTLHLKSKYSILFSKKSFELGS